MEITEDEAKYLIRRYLVEARHRDDAELEKAVIAAHYHIDEAKQYRDIVRYFLEDDGLYIVRISRKQGKVIDDVCIPRR